MYKILIILVFILSVVNLILILARRMDEGDSFTFAYCYKCRKFLTFDSLHAEHIKNHHHEGEKTDATEIV